jgi:hypothetical protein
MNNATAEVNLVLVDSRVCVQEEIEAIAGDLGAHLSDQDTDNVRAMVQCTAQGMYSLGWQEVNLLADVLVEHTHDGLDNLHRVMGYVRGELLRLAA